MHRSLLPGLLITAGLTCAAPVSGVVLHPDRAQPASHPPAEVMTSWAGGSAVAISPNWFVSTRHQGGNVGNSVTFGGATFTVVESVALVDPPRDGLNGLATDPQSEFPSDAVLWRVDGTLPAWTPVATAHVTTGTRVTIGGFGRTRSGTARLDSQNRLGYDVTSSGGTLTWGANHIESRRVVEFLFNDGDSAVDARAMAYTADFDSPDGGDVAEATLAQGDSGGGWFINDGGDWKLVGLSNAVEHPDRAIFGEVLYAVALPDYAGSIHATIPEPGTLILLASGVGVMAGWRRR